MIRTKLAASCFLMSMLLLPMTSHATDSNTAASSPREGGKASLITTNADQIEAHIKMLHAKLKITPAEQAQWLVVAQIIRDNEQQMFMLTKSRAEKTDLNAIDDLKSYSKIADAHANDIKKFIPAFTKLYNNMSAAQKKNADALFHRQQQDGKHFNREPS